MKTPKFYMPAYLHAPMVYRRSRRSADICALVKALALFLSAFARAIVS